LHLYVKLVLTPSIRCARLPPTKSLSKRNCEPYREGYWAISAANYRVNDQIRAREVRLITDTNENIGVVPYRTALEMAEAKNLDLVEVSPNADPPVCRIMDFGKFQYEKRRREREAKKQQKVIEVKEIQLRPKTDQHHLSFKIRDARGWIKEGMKVRVRVRFRGRERDYPDIAQERMLLIASELQDVAVVEQHPTMEGNTMLMVLSPASSSDKKK
jgi:translation initiation factor IF-3